VIKRDPRLHWSVYIGAAGKPGETAFMGWREYSNAKKVSSLPIISSSRTIVDSLEGRGSIHQHWCRSCWLVSRP
jgi:hypothetical protein